jgi:hypothetical protein
MRTAAKHQLPFIRCRRWSDHRGSRILNQNGTLHCCWRLVIAVMATKLGFVTQTIQITPAVDLSVLLMLRRAQDAAILEDQPQHGPSHIQSPFPKLTQRARAITGVTTAVHQT